MNILTPRPRHPATGLPARRRPVRIDIPLLDDGSDPNGGCGWFDSSLELRQGLAVRELPEADTAVAALWFPALAEAGTDDSARLQ